MNLETAVAAWDTPLYSYDLAEIRRAHAELTESLPASRLYYSVKANPNPHILAALRERGCSAEVTSSGELNAALTAGFDGAGCLYTGPGKTRSEIRHAMGSGVRRFSIESSTELLRVGAEFHASGMTAEVLLRINAHDAARTGLRMSGEAAQFGMDVEEVAADPELFLGVPGTRVVGLHFFPISGARDEESLTSSLIASVAHAGRLHECGVPLDLLDLGGGFGAPYAQPGPSHDYPKLREAVSRALDLHVPRWRAGRPEVSFESGRRLVGGSGRLFTSVLDVRRRGGRTFVTVDAGINHLGGMVGLGRLVRPAATPLLTGPSRVTELVTIVGPLCTPADVVARDVDVVLPAVGDVIEFPNVGAYALTASLIAFLGRPAPAEVVVDGADVIAATRPKLTHDALPLREV